VAPASTARAMAEAVASAIARTSSVSSVSALIGERMSRLPGTPWAGRTTGARVARASEASASRASVIVRPTPGPSEAAAPAMGEGATMTRASKRQEEESASVTGTAASAGGVHIEVDYRILGRSWGCALQSPPCPGPRSLRGVREHCPALCGPAGARALRRRTASAWPPRADRPGRKGDVR
jgi:hypothetical protein